jgi:hypothetical protein
MQKSRRIESDEKRSASGRRRRVDGITECEIDMDRAHSQAASQRKPSAARPPVHPRLQGAMGTARKAKAGARRGNPASYAKPVFRTQRLAFR